MEIKTVPLHRVIAEFMSASTPVEKYLHQNGPLTAQEFDSISLTITSLETFLDGWKKKNEVPGFGAKLGPK